jgi:uncharacterized protein with HEPN domain
MDKLGKKLQDYLEDLDFRLASERAFILIGEAMALLKRHYPEISLEHDDRSAAIGFRNFLVHQYWNIDNRDVWTTLTANVGPLHDAVLAMLKKLDAAE